MKCVYCSVVLNESNSSKEHIIHNALGGLLQSNEICCKECNERLGEKTDAAFTKIFAPITENMNIKRTRDTVPAKYNAVVCDKDKNTYKVEMKGKKVWTVFSEKGEYLNNSIDINNLKIVELTLEVDNAVFTNGFKKIAFNFAVHSGIDPKKLNMVYDAERKCLNSDILSNVIPFVPLNFFDAAIENLEIEDLKHTLILFSYENILVAYIELFDIFQFYVLLTENWDDEGVYFSYCQKIEKVMFDEEDAMNDLKIHDYKDMMIIADQYGLEYSTDFLAIEKEAFHKLRKRSYEIDLMEYIYKQAHRVDPLNKLYKGDTFDNYTEYMYYFIPEAEFINDSGDIILQNEQINKARFRISNVSKGKNDFYIRAINKELQSYGFDRVVKPHTHSQMRKLTRKLFPNSF